MSFCVERSRFEFRVSGFGLLHPSASRCSNRYSSLASLPKMERGSNERVRLGNQYSSVLLFPAWTCRGNLKWDAHWQHGGYLKSVPSRYCQRQDAFLRVGQVLVMQDTSEVWNFWRDCSCSNMIGGNRYELLVTVSWTVLNIQLTCRIVIACRNVQKLGMERFQWCITDMFSQWFVDIFETAYSTPFQKAYYGGTCLIW